MNGEGTDVTLYFFKIRDEDDIQEFIEEGPSHMRYNFFEAWPSNFFASEYWANIGETWPSPSPFYMSEYWANSGGAWPSPTPYFISEYWANSGGLGFAAWPTNSYRFFEAWPSYCTRTTGRKAGRLNHNMINGKYIVYIPGCDEWLGTLKAVEVNGANITDFNIELRSKVTLSGSIGNYPLSFKGGVSYLALYKMDGAESYYCEVDSISGRYSVDLTPGRYILQYNYYEDRDDDCDGMIDACEAAIYTEYYEEKNSVADATPIVIENDTPLNFIVNIEGLTAGSFKGTVTDSANGDPLKNAEVKFMHYRLMADKYITYKATTDKNGHYEIEIKNLFNGDSLIAFVKSSGYHSEFLRKRPGRIKCYNMFAATPVAYQANDSVTVNFSLDKADESGHKIYGCVLKKPKEEATEESLNGFVTAYIENSDIPCAVAEIDSNGNYDFGKIFKKNSIVYLVAYGDNSYWPEIYDNALDWQDENRTPVNINESDVQADFELGLRAPRSFPIGSISGKVKAKTSKSGSGDELKGAMVLVRKAGADNPWLEVDFVNEEGAYNLPIGGTGNYEVMLSSPGYENQTKSITIEDDGDINVNDVDFVLEGTAINDKPNHIVKKYKVYSAYPNPFNPSTTIRLDIPKKEKISLIIYNVMGQKVKTLYNGIISPGSHTVRWNGKDSSGKEAASGIYFYQLRSENVVQTESMLLLK